MNFYDYMSYLVLEDYKNWQNQTLCTLSSVPDPPFQDMITDLSLFKSFSLGFAHLFKKLHQHAMIIFSFHFGRQQVSLYVAMVVYGRSVLVLANNFFSYRSYTDIRKNDSFILNGVTSILIIKKIQKKMILLGIIMSACACLSYRLI